MNEMTASVLHELLFIVSLYAALRALELTLSGEGRYHSPGHASVMRIVAMLCLLAFGLYVFLGAVKLFP